MVSVNRTWIVGQNLGAPPSWRKILEMNCREQIREYLIAERMRHWLMIARHPFLGKGCPKWRARKNFWALVRKYRMLADRHGLRETDVF